MTYLTSYKVRRKTLVFSLVIFLFLEQNCPEMISETKKLLKVNGLDFDCEPLGK